MADPDWRVRFEAGRPAPVDALAVLGDDPEPEVSGMAGRRLEELLSKEEKT